jgi:hypothetical protein
MRVFQCFDNWNNVDFTIPEIAIVGAVCALAYAVMMSGGAITVLKDRPVSGFAANDRR